MSRARSRWLSALRRRLPLAALLVAVAASGGCGDRGGPRGLVLVTIDTCRADRIGCYGAGPGRTPALDALAGRGTRFVDVQAAAPLTLPSHATILTGLYPDRHGLRDNGQGRLPDEAVTIAEVLAEAGWSTAAFVSAFPVDRQFGLDQGFAVYDDRLEESSAGRAAGAAGDARDTAQRFFYDERHAGATMDAALPWIDEALDGDRPFFAWIHFFDPHAVYDPPARFVRGTGLDAYGGEIAYVDEQIGRLLDRLRERDDRIVVAVTADHGEALGDHGEVSHGLFVYQSTLRVPWILAGPGVGAGVEVEEPVSLVRVPATLLDLVGVAPPEGIDGASAVPLLRGEEDPDDAPLVGECLLPRFHLDWAGLRSVRVGDWKLIEAPRPELYDLATDPGETDDVAARNPGIVERLRGELHAYAARGGALAVEGVAADDATRARLEALGYVGGPGADPGEVDADLWNLDGRDPKDMAEVFNRIQEVPTLLFEGRTDDAAKLLEDLRTEDPGNRNVLEKLAWVRRLQERWADARDVCRAHLAIDPGNASVRRNLAHCLLELGDPDAARAELRRVLDDDPESARTWGMLAALELEAGRGDEAVEAAERAIALEPDEPERRADLAQAYEAAGRAADALAAWDALLAADPASSLAVNGKALLLGRLGRPREATRVLEEALPSLSRDVDTLNNLAWLLADRAIDPTRALEIARRAVALAPDDPVVLDTLGWSAIRAGRAGEAIAPLERAWRATQDAEVRAHLGVALAESGREREGREHVRAAVADRPDLADVPEVARWQRRS